MSRRPAIKSMVKAMKRSARVLLVSALLLAAAAEGTAMAATEPGAAASPTELRAQATEHLKFLYAMYFAIRGCTEAAEEQGEPRFRPTVSYAEAQSVLRAADEAARAVGVDVDAAWLEMSAVGQAAGEALKTRGDGNFQKCQQSGMFFRTITSRLQMTIRSINGTIPIIRRDY